MSKNSVCPSRSISSASCNSILSDLDEIIDNGIGEITVSNKNLRPVTAARTQKAKRVRFYHNGNKFFNGVVVPVAEERYRTLDSLKAELTNILMKNVTLPCGVRTIYSMEGKKVLFSKSFSLWAFLIEFFTLGF